MALVMASASAGFESSSQRRGVTPLVLLLNRSGKRPARSLTVVLRNNSEWMAATPLVLCDPTIAIFVDQTHAAHQPFISPGPRPHSFEQPPIDLEHDLEMPRQHFLKPSHRP